MATAVTIVESGGRSLADMLTRVAEIAPVQVDRARTELAHTLASIRGSAVGEAAWRSSCLTPNRHPVEVALSSASDELRTVVDVIAPEQDRSGALARALDLAEQHGAVPLEAHLRTVLTEHQRALPLRFGAWLGSRHRRDTTAHKIYVELSNDVSSAWALLDRVAPEVRRLVGGVGRPRFVGIPLDDFNALEIYVRPAILDDLDIAACLGRVGIGHMTEPIVSAMGGAWTAPPGTRLRGRNHGLSVTVHDGGCVAVATFTFAHDRHRLDHRVRRHVLAVATAEAWPSRQMYEACTRPLAIARPMRRPWHSALSEVVRVGSDVVEHHIGFAPPPHPPAPRPPLSTPRQFSHLHTRLQGALT